jgi:hypothetical protein
MEIPVLGMIVLPLAALCLLLPARWMLCLVFFLAPFKASSVLNFSLGGAPSGLQAGYFAALVFLLKVGLDAVVLGRLRYSREVLSIFSMLGLFVAYAAVSALLLPGVFAGTIDVYPITAGLREDDLRPLAYGPGNFTQTVYLAVNVLLAAALANSIVMGRDFLFASRAYIAATAFIIVMGLYQLAAHYLGFWYPYDIINNNPGYRQNYAQQVLDVKRFSSVFTEPSAAAHWLSGFVPFALVAYLRRAHGAWLMWVALAAAGCLLVATSTTGYAVALLLLGYVGYRAVLRLAGTSAVVSRRAARLAVVSALAVVGVGALIWASGILELVNAVMDKVVVTKLASESAARRLGGDAHAIDVFLSTFGLGTGWGSNRASSQLLRVASTVGIAGLVILFVFVLGLLRRHRTGRAAIVDRGRQDALLAAHGWAVLGMFLAALVAAGDPNALGFWIGLAIYTALLTEHAGVSRAVRRLQEAPS